MTIEKLSKLINKHSKHISTFLSESSQNVKDSLKDLSNTEKLDFYYKLSNIHAHALDSSLNVMRELHEE